MLMIPYSVLFLFPLKIIILFSLKTKNVRLIVVIYLYVSHNNISIQGIMALPFRVGFSNVKGRWLIIPIILDTYLLLPSWY